MKNFSKLPELLNPKTLTKASNCHQRDECSENVLLQKCDPETVEKRRIVP